MDKIIDSRILSIDSTQTMIDILQEKGNISKKFKKGSTIHVWNKMEKSYSYTLQEAPGTNFDSEFNPHFTPQEMLRLGVFEGKYLNDCLLEFPAEWFIDAITFHKLSPKVPNTLMNLFQVKSRQPLSIWDENGWLPSSKTIKKPRHPELASKSINPDERGWFQWYCRYWLGRRIPTIDAIQISRWKAFARHAGQIKANCPSWDLDCRPIQRQALLQWSWNPYI
jgi:hypothetical protein